MTNNAPVDVAYTEASMEQVSALVDLSAYCYQEIIYDCQNAPLNGDNGKQMHSVTPIVRLRSIYTKRNLDLFQFTIQVQQSQRYKEKIRIRLV